MQFLSPFRMWDGRIHSMDVLKNKCCLSCTSWKDRSISNRRPQIKRNHHVESCFFFQEAKSSNLRVTAKMIKVADTLRPKYYVYGWFPRPNLTSLCQGHASGRRRRRMRWVSGKLCLFIWFWHWAQRCLAQNILKHLLGQTALRGTACPPGLLESSCAGQHLVSLRGDKGSDVYSSNELLKIAPDGNSVPDGDVGDMLPSMSLTISLLSLLCSWRNCTALAWSCRSIFICW